MFIGALTNSIPAQLLTPGMPHKQMRLPSGSQFEIIDTIPQTPHLSLGARLSLNMGVIFFVLIIRDQTYLVDYSDLIGQIRPRKAVAAVREDALAVEEICATI